MQELPNTHFTINFKNLLAQVSDLYEKHAPDVVKKRKNIHLAKQPDAVILSCYLLGILYSCKTLIGTYRLACSIYGKDFPSRTRFIRTCNHLQPTLALINQALVQENVTRKDSVGLVDSLPIPLCQPIRNRRAHSAQPLATIGYNATKNFWFYGLKFHAIVSRNGLILNFLLSSASLHDAKAVEDLTDSFFIPTLLGDAGYVGKELANRLSKRGIRLIAIPRKSMKEANTIDYSIVKKQRKAIETVFSSLEILGIETIHAHSVKSIMTRVQLTVLLYNLLLIEAHKREYGTLKFSIGLECLGG